MSGWDIFDTVLEAGSTIMEDVAETPLIGTAYHGARALTSGLIAGGEALFGSDDRAYDQGSEAMTQLVEAIPFMGTVSGGLGLHEGMKEYFQDDVLGYDGNPHFEDIDE